MHECITPTTSADISQKHIQERAYVDIFGGDVIREVLSRYPVPGSSPDKLELRCQQPGDKSLLNAH